MKPLAAWLALMHAMPVLAALPNGVAFGDISQDSAWLWARSDTFGTVKFEVADDAGFSSISFTFDASVVDPMQPVKGLVSGLSARQQYCYRATDSTNASFAGSFRTAAAGTYNGFADAGNVLIKTRQAADLLGATRMDRAAWIAVDQDGWVSCTLTNNSNRGADKQPGVDAANPRVNNTMDHIIRWREDGDFDGATFQWNHFVLAGDPANERAEALGNVKGDAFGCPDGLWVDSRGVLWIQTDMSTSAMRKGDLAKLGNNCMLAADPRTGEIRRFLTGPAGCELTGATGTPDGRTMFVNIQHPGESPSERSDPEQPRRISNWPDQDPAGRPRSATVVIRKNDGGVIGG